MESGWKESHHRHYLDGQRKGKREGEKNGYCIGEVDVQGEVSSVDLSLRIQEC